jgi:PAS domain S-box-containing protein
MTVAILILMNSAQIVTVYDHRLVIIAILLALLVFCAAGLATLLLKQRLFAHRLELVVHERRYRLLFERSPVGVFRTTLSGRVLEINEAGARIFGYESRMDFRSQNAQQLYFDPQERDRLIQKIKRTNLLPTQKLACAGKTARLSGCSKTLLSWNPTRMTPRSRGP